MTESPDLLVRGIGELVTNDPDRDEAGLLGIVTDAAVAISGGEVAWAGPLQDLPDEYFDLPDLDCAGRVLLPGFVDSHTHLVFAGERSDEFARRTVTTGKIRAMPKSGKPGRRRRALSVTVFLIR